MKEPITELSRESAAGWPATPDRERLEQALTTLTTTEAVD